MTRKEISARLFVHVAPGCMPPGSAIFFRTTGDAGAQGVRFRIERRRFSEVDGAKRIDFGEFVQREEEGELIGGRRCGD